MTDQTPQAAQTQFAPLTRRRLTALAGAGVAVPLLAACGSDDTATDAGGSSTPGGSASSGGASSAAPTEGGSSAAAGGLTSTADIEVEGGAIFPDEKVVVTQPSEGEFRCFSNICTHQGCPVTSVDSEGIHCDCHGSIFSLEDGEPTEGPASAPLETVEITVSGDQISLA